MLTVCYNVNQIAIEVAVMIIIIKLIAPNELAVTPLLTLLNNDYKNINNYKYSIYFICIYLYVCIHTIKF